MGISEYSTILMVIVTTIYTRLTYLVLRANREAVGEMVASREAMNTPNMVLDMLASYQLEDRDSGVRSDSIAYYVSIRNAGGGDAYDVSVDINIKKDTTGIYDIRTSIDEWDQLSAIGSNFPTGVCREYNIHLGLEEYNEMERVNQPPQKYLEIEFTMRYKHRTLSNEEESNSRVFTYNTGAIKKELPYRDTGAFQYDLLSEMKKHRKLIEGLAKEE